MQQETLCARVKCLTHTAGASWSTFTSGLHPACQNADHSVWPLFCVATMYSSFLQFMFGIIARTHLNLPQAKHLAVSRSITQHAAEHSHSMSTAAPPSALACHKHFFTGTAHVLVQCMQGDCDAGWMPASSHGAHSQCSAPQPALPGHPQQRRTLPAHCAGLLSCQCLDQRLPGQFHSLDALHLQLII